MGVDHIIYSVPVQSELYNDVRNGLPPERIEMLHSIGHHLEQGLLPQWPTPMTPDFEIAWVRDMRKLSPSVVHRWAQVDRRFEGVVWLLYRIPSVEVPPEWIVYGDKVLGNSCQRQDAVRLNSPEVCSEVAATLAPLESAEIILEHYDDEERQAAGLYKRGGNAQALARDILRLRQFYLETAEHGDAAIASIW